MPTFFSKPPGQQTNRGLSRTLWDPGPSMEASILRFDEGWGVSDDFLDLPTGRYTATQATAGTFALGTAEGGVALLDCNSTTAAQGINVQLGGAAGASFKPQANSTIWFEARVKAADIATGPEFFLGLAEIDTSIIAASAISAANHIGFGSITDNNILLQHGEKAGAANSPAATGIHTLVDDTYVKLGFKVTGVTKVEWYVNGVRKAASFNLATANIPIVELTPTFVCQSGGTTDPIVHVDWYAAWQKKMS